ncbi:uncharacterized protein [Cicer arietinum]|uniref:Uncharacterized protein LOC105851554 isoform X2 n=1 Tax=Cicer arietinum TaxID=3827 RepID=A0A1S3DY81_CICAR|nr:uncharacterized protein LOC105851554 isoform X2 [Cicer arietinum]
MKLRPEFEAVRGASLNRSHVPSLDTCVGELLNKEQHLLTQGTMSHDVVVSEPVTVAYVSCSICKLAKSKTLPFPSGAHRASTCFEMTHSDVWGTFNRKAFCLNVLVPIPPIKWNDRT